MRPLSDLAAMSGIPQHALITLIVRAARSTSWVKKVYRGLNLAAARFKVGIGGGEASDTCGPAAISVCISGFVENNRWVGCRGGKKGGGLFVTGRLGGSIRGQHLRFVPQIEESRSHTKNFPIRAMIGLSGGLGADLPRLAGASKLDVKIDIASLPLNPCSKIDKAISDGEEYELLFAVAPRERKRLQQAWRKKSPRIPLTRIGCLNRRSAICNLQSLRGYVHFQ
jgi:thiamine-monophosphate kinase